MKNRLLLRIVLGGCLALSPALADTETNAPETAKALLRSAYLKLVEAELARAGNQPENALAAYRRAQDLYGQLYNQYPGWQGELVSYRAADCHNQIAILERVVAQKVGPDGSGTNAPAAVVPTEPRLTALTAELRQAREWLSPAPPKAPRPPELGQDTTDPLGHALRALQEERDALLRENTTLHTKLARLDTHAGPWWKKAPPKPPEPVLKLCPSVLKTEARRLLKEGENETAVTLMQETVTLLPEDTEIMALLGAACCHAERYAEAVPVLKEVVRRDPKNATAFVVLGSAYMGLGQLGEARVAMEEALRLAPKSPEAHYNMAQILLALNPPDIAGATRHYGQSQELGSPADPAIEELLRKAVLLEQIKHKHK